MLRKNPLLLSTNDNKLNLSHLSEINQGIISLENFDKSLILIEKLPRSEPSKLPFAISSFHVCWAKTPLLTSNSPAMSDNNRNVRFISFLFLVIVMLIY